MSARQPKDAARTIATGDSDSPLFDTRTFSERATISGHFNHHPGVAVLDVGRTRPSDQTENIRARDSELAPPNVEVDHPTRKTGTQQALKEAIPINTRTPNLSSTAQLEDSPLVDVDLGTRHSSPDNAIPRSMQDSQPYSELSFTFPPHSSTDPSSTHCSVNSSSLAPCAFDLHSELRGSGDQSDNQRVMSSSLACLCSSHPATVSTLFSSDNTLPQVQLSPSVSPEGHHHSHSFAQESYNEDDGDNSISQHDIRTHHRHPSDLDPSSCQRHVTTLDQYNDNLNNNLNNDYLHPSSSTLVITTAGLRGSQKTSSLYSDSTQKSQRRHRLLGALSQKEQDRRPVSPSPHDISLYLPDPPDGGWKAWTVVLASVLIQTFTFAPTEFIFGVFEQEYSLMFPGASPSSIALIGTIGTSSTYTVGFLAGTCSDRWGYRVTACAGAIIMTLSLFLASFSTQLWHYYFSQGILYGIGASLAYFSSIAAPTHWFKRKRGLAMGISASGSGLGGFYLAPLSQYLVDRLGLQWTLRVLGIYCIVFCGGAALFLFEPDLSEEEKKMVKLRRQRSQTNSTFRIPAFSKEWVFAMLVVFQFLVSMAYLTPIYFMELYSTHIGLSKQMGALINGWFNGASFAARILSGILADIIVTDVVLLVCAWTSALSILVIWTLSKTFPVYMLFAIVYGISFSGTCTVTPVMVADYYGPAQVSSVLGIVYGLCCAALLCGTLISGQILEMTKPRMTYLPVIMYSGGMFTLSAFCATLWIFLMRYRRKLAIPEGAIEGEEG